MRIRRLLYIIFSTQFASQFPRRLNCSHCVRDGMIVHGWRSRNRGPASVIADGILEGSASRQAVALSSFFTITNSQSLQSVTDGLQMEGWHKLTTTVVIAAVAAAATTAAFSPRTGLTVVVSRGIVAIIIQNFIITFHIFIEVRLIVW